MTLHAFQKKLPNHGPSAFVTKLNALGLLEYSTYLGGGGDQASAIAVDEKGRAYVAGDTASAIFPTTADAFQRKLAGTHAAFWSHLDEHGSAALYSTLLSGSASDVATA